MAAGARLARVLLGTIIVAASGIYAYVEMFSHFRFYDDEGFLMASVKSFVDGAILYDEAHTLYGPFYYLVAKFMYFVAGVPVSHDATRLATIAFWLGTAALTAGFTYRLTSSFAWTSVTYLQTVLHAWGLCREPGHPQTMLIFLGMAVPLVSAVLGPMSVGSAVLGVLAIGITLTKVNLGIYTLLALTVTYLGLSVPTRLIRAGFVASSVVATMLPFIVMRNHLSEWALDYASTSAITIAACCVIIGRQTTTNRVPLSAVGVFIASGITAAVLVVSVTLLAGTSLKALVTETLIEPARFPTLFAVEWELSPVAIIVAALSVGLAMAFARLDRSPRAALALLVKLTLGAGVVITMFGPRSALMVIAPLIWVTVISPRPEPWGVDALFPRAVVSLLAALYLLTAYPVSGSQQDWATVLLIPVAVINLADAGSILASQVPPGVRVATQATFLAVIVVVYSAILDPLRSLDKYSSLSPLNLHGATRIRLDAQQVRVYQDLVKNIESECETFATVPNFMSLHFWTQKAPPDGFSTERWITLLDDDTQRRLVSRYMPWPRIPESLAAYPSACVIYNQSAASTWTSVSSLDDGPLLSYVRQSFRTVRTIGDYELMVRQ